MAFYHYVKHPIWYSKIQFYKTSRGIRQSKFLTKMFGVSDLSGGIFGPQWFSDTGIPVTPWTALQSAAVYGCVKVISEDVAKLPIRVLGRVAGGGWAEAPDHPISRLLRAPNDYQTPFDFWAFLVTSHQLRGNGYVVVVRNKFHEPIKLVPMIPDKVVPLMTPNGRLFYQVTAPQLDGQHTYNLPRYNILHIKNMSLDGGLVGTSVIWCSQNVIGLSLAEQKHAATMFRQGTMINGVLQTPDGVKLDAEVAARLGSSFSGSYSGSDNAHRIAVLEQGLKFQPIGMNAEDAQLIESRKLSSREIASIFRVPNHKIGLDDHSTFNNIENLNQQYIDDTLMGVCRRIEEACEMILLDDDERDNYKIRFDFDQLLRGDFESRMRAYQMAAMNGFFNINEVRGKEGMPPIKFGDIHRIPLNIGPITDKPPTPTAGKPSESTQDEFVPTEPDTNPKADEPPRH